MITLDAATQLAYEAAATAEARAALLVAALTAPVYVRVYDSSDTLMGSGTMTAPWATASGTTITVGEVASFTVATGGTPDADWHLSFESGTKFAKGSFGLPGSGQDFIWSRPTWEAGQTGTLGTVTLTSTGPQAPAFTVAPTSSGLPATGGTIQFTATDPEGGAIFYSLTTTREGITIDSSSGLVTVTGDAAGTSGSIVVKAEDPTGLSDTATCAVTVQAVAPSALKFNPGHYCQVYNTTQATRWAYYDSTVTNNANLLGVVVGWKWNELEGATAGDYSAGIATVRAELTKLRSFAQPKRLGIYVYEEGYGDGPAAIFPQYMVNNGLAYADGSHAYWQKFTTAGMDRMIALVQAYGAEFDGEADVELFRPMVESAITGSAYVNAGEAAYRAQLIRLWDAIRTYWPTTLAWMPFNWEPWSSISTAVNDAVSRSIAIGGPDTVTDTAHEDFPRADSVALGLLGGYNYVTSLEIPIVKGVEDSEMGENSVGPVGGYTAAQIFAFCNSTMRASHIVWPRQQSINATAAQAWATGIVPMMANPLTYTSPRTRWQ